MGAYQVSTLIHDDELERFIEAARDPELADLARRGALPDSAFALASVAPYIADCIARAIDERRSTP